MIDLGRRADGSAHPRRLRPRPATAAGLQDAAPARLGRRRAAGLAARDRPPRGAVVDTETWAEVARIPVAGQPVFVMARPDGRQVWVNFAVPDLPPRAGHRHADAPGREDARRTRRRRAAHGVHARARRWISSRDDEPRLGDRHRELRPTSRRCRSRRRADLLHRSGAAWPGACAWMPPSAPPPRRRTHCSTPGSATFRSSRGPSRAGRAARPVRRGRPCALLGGAHAGAREPRRRGVRRRQRRHWHARWRCACRPSRPGRSPRSSTPSRA